MSKTIIVDEDNSHLPALCGFNKAALFHFGEFARLNEVPNESN